MVKTEPTVFVVDDDKKILVALRFLLEAEDLNVETYSSAQDFLSHYRNPTPGCLLLDLRMPGLNGLTLQELLSVNGVNLPIVIITGQGDRLMTLCTIDTGTVDKLNQSFDQKGLVSRIRAAIAGDTV